MDSLEHGDRRGDRRTVNRRTHDDPRGAAARLGPCRECGIETDHLALWNGRAVSLCAECARSIRAAGFVVRDVT